LYVFDFFCVQDKSKISTIYFFDSSRHVCSKWMEFLSANGWKYGW